MHGQSMCVLNYCPSGRCIFRSSDADTKPPKEKKPVRHCIYKQSGSAIARRMARRVGEMNRPRELREERAAEKISRSRERAPERQPATETQGRHYPWQLRVIDGIVGLPRRSRKSQSPQ